MLITHVHVTVTECHSLVRDRKLGADLRRYNDNNDVRIPAYGYVSPHYPRNHKSHMPSC